MVCNRRDGVVAWQDTCPDSTKLMRNDILFPRCIRLAVSTSSRGSTSRMHTDSGLSSQTSWKATPAIGALVRDPESNCFCRGQIGRSSHQIHRVDLRCSEP